MAMPVLFSTLFWRINLNNDRKTMIRDRLLSEGIKISDKELPSLLEGWSYLKDMCDEVTKSLEHLLNKKNAN